MIGILDRTKLIIKDNRTMPNQNRIALLVLAGIYIVCRTVNNIGWMIKIPIVC